MESQPEPEEQGQQGFLKPCPRCGEKYSAQKRRCPSCGVSRLAAQQEQRVLDQGGHDPRTASPYFEGAPERRDRRSKGRLIFAGGVLLLASQQLLRHLDRKGDTSPEMVAIIVGVALVTMVVLLKPWWGPWLSRSKRE